MPRPTIVTEARLREDVEVLRQHADENGIYLGGSPSRILKEHHGYSVAMPTYVVIRTLEERGRLQKYPPSSRGYVNGYQVDPLNQEALEKRFAAVKAMIDTEVVGYIEDLKGVVEDLGKLAAQEALKDPEAP